MGRKNDTENNIQTEEVEKRAAGSKKPGKKKTGITVLLIVAVVAGIGVGLAGKVKKFTAEMQAQMEAMMGGDDDLYEVVRRNVKQEITTSGTVVGVSEKAYTSPVTAKVKEICVEVGQTVRKGDVLLTYDASELGDNLEKVKIQAQSERAMGNENFEQANRAAGKASEARQKAKKLKADIKKLKKDIETLNQTVEKYEEKLKTSAALPETEEDDSPDGFNPEDGIASAGQGLSAAEEKKYKKAISDLSKKQESLATKQSKLAEQEAIVAANEDVTVSESAKVQISASNRLSDMNVSEAEESYAAAEAGLTAEQSGIISSIDIVEGAYAGETQTLVTILDDKQIGVEFAIAKDDLDSILPGQRVRVVISGNEYNGTVEFVSRMAVSDSPLGNQTGGTIKGRIVLDNPDENIYIGVSAKAYIFVGESEQALTIPYEALCSDVEGDYVFVVNAENLIERKNVKTGICSDEYYEVLDGIAEGDRVIRNVTSGMKQGDEYVGNNAAVAGIPGMK